MDAKTRKFAIDMIEEIIRHNNVVREMEKAGKCCLDGLRVGYFDAIMDFVGFPENAPSEDAGFCRDYWYFESDESNAEKMVDWFISESAIVEAHLNDKKPH